MTKEEIAERIDELFGETLADVFDTVGYISQTKVLILSNHYFAINIFSNGRVYFNGLSILSISEFEELVKVRKKFMRLFQD
jgi:hypothetical protein